MLHETCNLQNMKSLPFLLLNPKERVAKFLRILFSKQRNIVCKKEGGAGIIPLNTLTRTKKA